MTPRISLFLAAGTACVASNASAQEAGADYANDDYVIAVPADVATSAPVTIEPLSEAQVDMQAVAPAVRSIPPRAQQSTGVGYAQTPAIAPVTAVPAYGSSMPSGNPIVAPVQHPMVTAARPVYTNRQGQPSYYVYPSGAVGGGQGMTYGQPGQLPVPPGGQVVTFDRAAWLRECDARLGSYEEQDRGKILGAVGGAVAGGIIGNRVAGRGNRVLGTVIGAGAGAATGGVIGDSIDDGNTQRVSAYAECEAYLNDYMQSAIAGTLEPQPNYYGQQYMLIPVEVWVPQQAIYREVE